MLPVKVHDLTPKDFYHANVPCYTHLEWTSYAQPIPQNALCLSIGRLKDNQIECFVGDGIHAYNDLQKFGADSGFIMRGNYDSSVVYYVGNLVVYDSSLWSCTESCTGAAPSSVSDYWVEMPINVTVSGGGEGEPV